MLKILIADDEGFVRKGLIKNINWSDLGISEIEQADDGLTALEIAREFKPDLLLSDIRMPNMTGIELASKLREILPDCKIIFMSGYSDKEYLKSAISLKAVSYVEKPIDLDEMNAAISAAVALCANEESQKKTRFEMESKLKENLLLTRNNIVLDLINRKANTEYISELLNLANLKFTNNGMYIVLILKLKFHEQYQSGVQEVTEAMDQILRDLGIDSITGQVNHDHIIAVIHDKSSKEEVYSKVILKQLGSQLVAKLKKEKEFFIGIGKPVLGLDNIYRSYQSAVVALQLLFYKGYYNFALFEDNAEGAFNFDDAFMLEFKKLLESEQEEQVLELLKNLDGSIKKCSNTLQNYIKDIYFRLLQVLFEIAKKRGLEVSNVETESFFWDSLSRFTLLEEVEEYLQSKVESYFEALRGGQSGNKTVSIIKKIVDNEYSNSNLSIKSISQSIFLSDAYLCVVFKKETGKTINQYITEVRIESAKELLKDRSIKLYDIATRVGYSDHNYFTKIFKKITQMTPSEYKEKRLEGNL